MERRCGYDIVVVGAGPIGSYTAYLLAQKGFRVGVLEKRSEIGNGVVCTGVIGAKAFERFNLPLESIVAKIDTAVFVSPAGQKLVYEPKDVFAHVVDRDIFDRMLLRRAVDAGVDVLFGQHVSGVERRGDSYLIRTPGRDQKARSVVIATGIDYSLHERAGLDRPEGFLHGAQVDLPLANSPSRIEVHIGQEFAPGSFGWIVPYRNGSSRVGVITRQDGRSWLGKMITRRVGDGTSLDGAAIKVKRIAHGPAKRSSKGGVLAVGEAAGQVKTTTGGGIYYGLLCAEIAADCLEKSVRGGAPLDDYDVAWHSALAAEFDVGKNLRALASKLSDEEIERLFTFVKQNRFWVELLIPRIDFDYHSDVIFYCLKSFKHLLQLNH